MRHLSKIAVSAIEAVAAVAHRADGGFVQSDDIYESLGLPNRSLEPILQRLVRCGILLGSRGPHGGYSLNRAPIDINLAEVVEAASQMKSRWEPARQRSSESVQASVGAMLENLDRRWHDDLRNITIDQLTAKAKLRLPSRP